MAQRIANGLESQVQAIKAGTADPREAGWAEAERKPLTDHAHDWHSSLAARGRNTVYVDSCRDHVLRLIEMTRATKISHLNISSVQVALAELRTLPGRCGNEGLSDQSLRHHARQIKQFSKWLWRDGRVREDPLVHLTSPTIMTRKNRKALDPAIAASLITTTRTQPFRWGLTGEERSMVYATALGTGFRAGELRSLTPESFNLDSEPPTITCKAESTKNGKTAVQPIPPELAELLRPWLRGKSPGMPVFSFRSDHAARMVRQDLEAAGMEDAGDYGLHCLRHTYVTLLVKSGTGVKVCQELARHSDPRLTMNIYSHLTVHDTARGLEGLAHILPTPCVSKGRTGTDDTPVNTRPTTPTKDRLGHAYRPDRPKQVRNESTWVWLSGRDNDRTRLRDGLEPPALHPPDVASRHSRENRL
jgi:integrase